MHIRLMTQTDITSVAKLHQVTFERQQHSLQWVQCNFNAFPRLLNFVADKDGDVVGYITWIQKSGFRAQAVIELEQLAISPHFQGQGIARQLITESLSLVKEQLSSMGATLKHIIVTTRTDNVAQQLYKSSLGAEVEATINDLYSADEVLMIARNISE